MKENLPREQCGMWKVLDLLCSLVFFLPPLCILNNVHWMLFSCVGCFCCWLFCLFLFVSKGKLYLKIVTDLLSTSQSLVSHRSPLLFPNIKERKSWLCLYSCTPVHPPPRLFLSDRPRHHLSAVACLIFSFLIFGFDDDYNAPFFLILLKLDLKEEEECLCFSRVPAGLQMRQNVLHTTREQSVHMWKGRPVWLSDKWPSCLTSWGIKVLF